MHSLQPPPRAMKKSFLHNLHKLASSWHSKQFKEQVLQVLSFVFPVPSGQVVPQIPPERKVPLPHSVHVVVVHSKQLDLQAKQSLVVGLRPKPILQSRHTGVASLVQSSQFVGQLVVWVSWVVAAIADPRSKISSPRAGCVVLLISLVNFF